jgi:hypothetical protein
LCVTRSDANTYTHGYSNGNAIRDVDTYTEACSNTKAAAYPGATPNSRMMPMVARL